MARNTINPPLPASASTGSGIIPFEIDGQAAQAAAAAQPVRVGPVSAQHASLPARVRQRITRPAMSARDRWENSTRILTADVRNLAQFSPDDQAVLLGKMLASLESKHAEPVPNEFAEIFSTWRQDASTLAAGCNAANAIRFMSLIAASSKHYPVTQEDNAAEGQRLQALLDTVTATPHAPPVQKSLLRVVKAYCRKSDVSVADRVSILKKLGETGPGLHAAPINDLRTSHNVQGYAYKLMKKELARLPLAGQAEVTLCWARQNSRWCTKLRTLSGQHWKNIGYATATVAVAGAASGGIAAAAVLGASGAAGVGVLIGGVVAKSVASGTVIGGATGIYDGFRHSRQAAAGEPSRAQEVRAATLTGGLAGTIIGAVAGIGSLIEAHANTTTTEIVQNSKISYYVPDNYLPASPLDIPVGEGVFKHIEPLPDTTLTIHGHGSLPAAAIEASVGALGAGIVVGAVSSFVARKATRGATKAILNAGGITGVVSKLRKNPVVSVQSAVQRTTANVFSYDRLPSDERLKAQAVVALRQHWDPWIETTLTLPPLRQAEVLLSLVKTFELENYHADDRSAVETATSSARMRLMFALADYNRRANPLGTQETPTCPDSRTT
jgi:hypothetical protein